MKLPERCTSGSDSQQLMRVALRSLPRMVPPSELTLRLRIMASKEHLADRQTSSRLQLWCNKLSLALDNLMKPIALPAAGGLCAALLLFMSLVPAFKTHRISLEDVPLWDLVPSTEPTLRSVAPIGFSYGDAQVDLRIDEHGRLINYSIVSGQPGRETDVLNRSIKNNLLFTTFKPATSNGVPISSTIRLSFQSSRIDVKG